jgi:hypothetical protein
MKMSYLVNVTAKEFCYAAAGQEQAILKELLFKHTSTTALLLEDVGDSRWKRTDKIVTVVAPPTIAYLMSQYSMIVV